MKHPRFYTALPRVGRVRSNSLYTNSSSLSSYFDVSGPPPPPNTRLTTHRLPFEARAELEGPNNPQNPHAPLALASPHAPTTQHPHPAQLALLFPYAPGPAPKPASTHHATGSRSNRRKGPRYTLDIGAYGIPKRGHRHLHSQPTDAPLAVQVGEDAYFVHENAMGVADGVGGWARVKNLAPTTGPSASALFARRLMHFCADEVDRAHSTPPVVAPWQGPSHASTSSWLPYTPPPPPHEDEYELSANAEPEDLASALEAELDDLADGIDVLNILERAYGRTLDAHVVPAPPSPSSQSSRPISQSSQSPTPPLWSFLNPAPAAPKTVPLRAGGSTALVAVLDYLPAGASPDLVDVASSGVLDVHVEAEGGVGLTPVLKIAHLGDCMGMLVRGDEIVWRSEEMWWRWNTPVQLSAAGSSCSPSPSSASASAVNPGTPGWWEHLLGTPTPSDVQDQVRVEITPSSAARVFTLPVRAGDILILASDGLGDNLWDEDVLEEVRRVCKLVGAQGSSPSISLSEIVGGGVGVMGEVDSARLRRQTLAGMLSEALCSRARRIATRRGEGAGVGRRPCVRVPGPGPSPLEPSMGVAASAPSASSPLRQFAQEKGMEVDADADETPFARRAREAGKEYRGGKNDDISVIVAVVAPAETETPAGGEREATLS